MEISCNAICKLAASGPTDHAHRLHRPGAGTPLIEPHFGANCNSVNSDNSRISNRFGCHTHGSLFGLWGNRGTSISGISFQSGHCQKSEQTKYESDSHLRNP